MSNQSGGMPARGGAMRRETFLAIATCLLFAALNANAWREKEALEAYELGELELVSTYETKCGPEASIRDSNGYLHRLRVWGYVGKNFGIVKEISKSGVRIRELFRDGNDWKEREVWMKPRK